MKMLIPINTIEAIANKNGFARLDYQHNIGMISYQNAGYRINIYVSKMTVCVIDKHLKRNNQKTFRQVNEQNLNKIFNDKINMETTPLQSEIQKTENKLRLQRSLSKHLYILDKVRKHEFQKRFPMLSIVSELENFNEDEQTKFCDFFEELIAQRVDEIGSQIKELQL